MTVQFNLFLYAESSLSILQSASASFICKSIWQWKKPKSTNSSVVKKHHSTNCVSIKSPNTSSPATSPPIINESKQTPNQDVEKKPDAAPKAPAIDYPGGVSLIIVFVGLFLAALCVGLVRSLNSSV